MKDRMVTVHSNMTDMMEAWSVYLEKSTQEERDKVSQILTEEMPSDLHGLTKLQVRFAGEIIKGTVSPIVYAMLEPILSLITANVHAAHAASKTPELAGFDLISQLMDVASQRKLEPKYRSVTARVETVELAPAALVDVMDAESSS